METDIKNEPAEDSDVHTVILQNISMEEDIPIVFNEFSEGNNSDGQLRINSLDEKSNVIHTYIIENANEYTEEELQEMQEQLARGVDADQEREAEAEYVINESDIQYEEIEDEESREQYMYQEEENEEFIDDPLNHEDETMVTEDDDDIDDKTDLICDLCDKVFKTTAGLKRHITVNHGDDEFQEDPLTLQLCPCCGEPSDSAHTLGDFKCDDCDKLFVQENYLLRHRSIEHPEDNKYSCAECQQSFTEKDLLVDHMKVHPFKSVKCVGCNRIFTRKYHLDRHLVHTGCMGSPKQTFDCRVCKRFFTRKDNLAEHLRVHAGQAKKKPSLACQYCNKTFIGFGLLNIHIRTHTGERPYPCDFCEKKFPSSGAMKKHRRMHTGEKPYSCTKCDKKFAAKETLNRHVRTHTGDRPHRCQFCGKSFIQAMQLRAHIFHHTGENAFKCNHCDRAFNRRARLTTHVKYMHEGAQPLQCPQCSKSFFRKEDVARHMLSHSNEKPFQCDVCEKCFSVKSSLKTHQLIHRKEPPCSCDTCGRAFIRQDCLMRHIRARHRDVLEDIMANAEKKKLQQQLLNAASDAANKGDLAENIIWNELTLTESIKELLTLLVDDECLTDFGYPDAPVDRVLDSVIKRCGYTPASEEDFDYIGRMRENAKLLFTVVIDDEAVKELLNNQTVDEVILHVLRLAKKQNVETEEDNIEDEEEDDDEDTKMMAGEAD